MNQQIDAFSYLIQQPHPLAICICTYWAFLCFSLADVSPIRALIAGGGAPEIELAVRLAEYSRTLGGMEAYCVRAYSDALEVIPSTLAENAGLNPISTVTELRNRHAQGDKMAGINVRKVSAASLQGCIHNSTVVSAWSNSLFFLMCNREESPTSWRSWWSNLCWFPSVRWPWPQRRFAASSRLMMW